MLLLSYIHRINALKFVIFGLTHFKEVHIHITISLDRDLRSVVQMVLIAKHNNVVYHARTNETFPYDLRKQTEKTFHCLHCKKPLFYVNKHKRRNNNVHAHFRHEQTTNQCPYEKDIDRHLLDNSNDFHKAWTSDIVRADNLYGYWNKKDIYDIKTAAGKHIFVKDGIIADSEIKTKEGYGQSPTWILNGTKRSFQLYKRIQSVFIDFNQKVDIPHFTEKSTVYIDVGMDMMVKVRTDKKPDEDLGYHAELVSYNNVMTTLFKDILREDIKLQERQPFTITPLLVTDHKLEKIDTVSKGYITEVTFSKTGKWYVIQGRRTYDIPTTVFPDKVHVLRGMSLQYIENTSYLELSLPTTEDALDSLLLHIENDKNYKDVLVVEEYMRYKERLKREFRLKRSFMFAFKGVSSKMKGDANVHITKLFDKIVKSVKQVNVYNNLLFSLRNCKQIQYIKKPILYNICKYITNLERFILNPFNKQFKDWWKFEKFRVLENIALAFNVDKEMRCLAIIKRYICLQMMQGTRHSCVQRRDIWGKALIGCIPSDITEQYIKDIIDAYDGVEFETYKIQEHKKSKTMVYLKYVYDDELYISESIHEIIHSTSSISMERDDFDSMLVEYETYKREASTADGGNPKFKFNKEQQEAIYSSINNNFTLMTGPPGAGKSDVVKGLCYGLLHHCGYNVENILLCAPTGKAAGKLKYKDFEACKLPDGAKIEIPSSTLHSALYSTRQRNNDEQDSDDEDEDDMGTMSKLKLGFFEQKVIIVDEVSMLDTRLCRLLFQCIRKGNTKVLLIGDPHQLPSIGHGDFLRSLVRSEVIPKESHIDLIEVYRYGDAMKALSKQIKEGLEVTRIDSDHIHWYKVNNVTKIYEKIFSIYCKVQNKNQRLEEKDKKDLQVIIPTKKNEIGCITFNEFFHDKLKPVGHRGEFFQGEKVLCTSNQKGKNKVYNGDVLYMGSPSAIKDDVISMSVFKEVKWLKAWQTNPNPDENKNEGLYTVPKKHLDYCYGISIHKSQGSEWDYVILILNSQYHQNMLNRNLLYTAVTRVKKERLYIFYDSEDVLKECVAREFHRDTCLKYILQDTFGQH